MKVKIYYRHKDREKPTLSRRYKTMDRAQEWLSKMKYRPDYIIDKVEEIES